MNRSILAFAVLGGSTAFACAQSTGTDPVAVQEGCSSCAAQAGGGGLTAPRPGQPAVVYSAETELPDGNKRDWTAVGPAYAGQPGGVGALTAGRQYDLEYLALAGAGDPFQANTAGGAGSLVERAGHSLQFRSARIRGVTAGASYGIDGSRANRAWGMSLGIEAGPLTLRVAHQNRHVAQVHLYDSAGNNMEAKNSIVAANVKLGWGTAYAAYSVNRGWGSSPLFNPDNPYGASVFSTPSTDSRDVLLGFAVPAGRFTTLLASFIHKNDRDLANQDANEVALGATYAVSRRTDFYAAWSHIQNLNAGLGAPAGALGRTTSALNIGFRHAF